MSRDIRSFFSVKKPGVPATPAVVLPSPKPKRKALIISSDEDEKVKQPKSPKIHKKHKTESTKRSSNKRRIEDSSEDEVIVERSAPTNGKPNLKKLKNGSENIRKAVDISSVFGNDIIKHEKKPKLEKKARESLDLFGDDDEFDISCVDESSFIKSPKKTLTPTKEPEASKVNESIVIDDDTEEMDTNVGSAKKIKVTNSKTKEDEDDELQQSFAENDDLQNSSYNTEEDRQNKRRMAAIMYQQYKNRSGPSNPGSKEVPKGKPNCLAGLTFVLSGVYESLDRDEMTTIIKELGGKVTTSVSKKTTYLVYGEEAGLAKIAKCDELRIKKLTEDDLLQLIKRKSGISDNNNDDDDRKIKKENSIKVESAKEKEKSKNVEKETVTKVEVKKELDRSVKAEVKKEVDMVVKKEIESPPKIKKEIEAKKTPSATITKSKDIKFERQQTNYERDIKSDENKAWVEKYKPTSMKQIIGQQGAASNSTKLLNWLQKWFTNHNGTKKQTARPNPWAKNDDGSFFKAALLSGPPGVGKTTTAQLVCKELGYDAIEFNASDTRSKRLLKEEVSELLSNKSLYGYFHGQKEAVSRKHVLIMDEVDGMAGNEDRGGVAELILLIKDSSIPVICMCNDRNHPKMRSLVNYCFDLRFNKPRLEQIKGAMMSICFKEKIKLAPSSLDEIIAATNNDIRQTLNFLTLMSSNVTLPTEKSETTAKKDLKLGPWETVRKVFSIEDHKSMSLYDKSDLFFNDYSLGPLFVQQNYLSVAPKCAKSEVLKRIAQAADSLSLGDLVERRIRSNMAWSMLPMQAMYSSVLPGEYMAGNFTGQINFPGWLGKFSKTNKRSRLAQEIHDHTRIRTSGSRQSIRLDYAPHLLDKIIRPLKKDGADGVAEALETIKEYRLLREDIDSLIELTTWPGRKNPMDAVESKVKAALTRTYNKEVTPYTYTATAAIKKKKSSAQNDDDYALDGDDNEKIASDTDEDDDNLTNDALIKAKKTTTSRAASKASSSSSGSKSKKASNKKK